MVVVSKEAEYLSLLGLSGHEQYCYEALQVAGEALTSRQLAESLGVLPSAVYRLCYQLEQRGLIQRLGGRPRRFVATARHEALQNAYLHHQRQLRQLLGVLLEQSAPVTPLPEVQIIMGRQALYDEYIRQAEQAQQEIAVYAIGIAYSKALHHTQAAARKRGVRVRHIVQQLRPENYHIVHKWQRLGVRLRLLKTAQGFHLTLIDNRLALITFSEASDTEERLTIATTNPSAVAVMVTVFEQMWREAHDIDV
jgi:sugar-specific transcriptional regulator TrmB